MATSTSTPHRPAAHEGPGTSEPLVVYFLLGMYLGVIFIKSEVASWFRIQEMFHFDAFHMYGVIGAAVAVGAASVLVMKRRRSRTVRDEEIVFPSGEEIVPSKQHVFGGLAFGLGWGLIGACPGPLFALVGSGIPVMLVGLVAAMAGAWSYGRLKPHLPH